MLDSGLGPAPTRVRRHRAGRVAFAGATSLIVGMGIGRFAFTPVLPMMLHDGVVDLGAGSWLATMNYIGYLAGAMLCAALPRTWPATLLLKAGLVSTILLTAGMAWHVPALWPAMRLLAGIASAFVFVYTSGWCLARLAALGRPQIGSALFAGPGAGIALSGLVATLLVAFSTSATTAWIVFGLLALALTALIWPTFRDDARGRSPPPVRAPGGRPDRTGGMAEMATLTVAYGFAGFGYIITATFLPVIARESLPPSVWLDLFFPILGLATVAGCLLGSRLPPRLDPRHMLAACYLMQAAGVAVGLVAPTLGGFVLGSVLVGLPFTLLSFFAMQEVRRLRPNHAARFIGLLTAVYGIGQIAGPALVGYLLARTPTHGGGFAVSLGCAAAALLLGACLYVAMSRIWPIRRSDPGR